MSVLYLAGDEAKRKNRSRPMSSRSKSSNDGEIASLLYRVSLGEIAGFYLSMVSKPIPWWRVPVRLKSRPRRELNLSPEKPPRIARVAIKQLCSSHFMPRNHEVILCVTL